MNRLDGKVAVILGASNPDSMGAATARRFAAEGARVVLGARRLESLQEVAGSVDAIAVECDIRDEEQLAVLADRAISEFGRLDVAVNYAGVNVSAPISKISRDSLQLACDVHFIGSTLFFKHMGNRANDGGALITTSTLTALIAPPGMAAYAGTKRGVDQVVRIAAVEFGKRGIRVNAIAPGFVRSAMTEELFNMPSVTEAFEKETALDRLANVEDVANAALWLASDEAFITGQVIDVTAGQSLNRIPTRAEMAGGNRSK